jgi:hypothetical protein
MNVKVILQYQPDRSWLIHINGQILASGGSLYSPLPEEALYTIRATLNAAGVEFEESEVHL